MNKRKGRIFITSWLGKTLLGAGVAFLLGSGIFSTVSAQTAPYYIIDSNDSRYPQGCNTPGLSNPSQYCILGIPLGSTKILIAPANTEIAGDQTAAFNHCRSLNIAGFSRKMMENYGGLGEWNHAYANRGKLVRFNATAAGQQKSNHYRVTNSTAFSHNCTLSSWKCWSTGGERISTRCTSTTANIVIPPLPEGERCFDFNSGTITNYKKGAYSECGNNVTIPSTIGGKSVTAIGDNAFKNKGITSVVIPNSVTSIGNSAFRDNQIASVEISDSLTTISDWAFMANKLSSVVIPTGVKVIANHAFRNNQISSLTLPDTLTHINLRAFQANKLTSVEIPTSVTTISTYAFNSNPWLASLGGKVEGRFKGELSAVSVASDANIQLVSPWTPAKCFDFDTAKGQITNYKKGVYPECWADVIIPPTIGAHSVRSIWTNAFRYKGLTWLTIPNSVTSIRFGAFSDNQLTSVIIPNSVTNLSGSVFMDNKLTSIIIPDSVTSLEYAAFRRNKLTSVIIWNSVPELQNHVFGENQLTSVTIPNSVTKIGDYAFYYNPLTSVTIPNSVTKIGNYAFWGGYLTWLILLSQGDWAICFYFKWDCFIATPLLYWENLSKCL